MRTLTLAALLPLAGLMSATTAHAGEPWLAPGNAQARHDIQLRGKPVLIYDLARRMVRLSGLTVRDESTPEGDIEIQITGLRPAEKLFEELLIGNKVTGTEHPRILRAMEHSLPWEQVRELLHMLLGALGQLDVKMARELLLLGVREYQPSGGLVDHIWLRRDNGLEPRANVTSLKGLRAAGR